MAIRIGALCADTATVAVQINGETLHVTYRPDGVTPAMEDQLRELVEARRGGASLVAMLGGTLAEWDLLDDDGEPLPVDEATLRHLPLIFLTQVAEAISEDMRPNPTSGEASAAG